MNFDKENFSKILIEIKNSYGSINQMAEKTGITSAYISKLIRLMYDNAPSPEILKRISENSNGIISYSELMEVCGYYDETSLLKKIEFETLQDYKEDLYELNFTQKQKKELIRILSSFSNINSNILLKHISNFCDEFKENRDIIYKLILNMLTSITSKYQNHVFDLGNSIGLSEKQNQINTQFYKCPVYGQISAGQPNWAEECLIGYIPLDVNLINIHNPEECFFLKVNGESMNKKIKNGSFALIHKQDIVENNDIAVVLVNGYDATLKKFTKRGDNIALEPMSDDSSFETQIYGKDTEIKVLGKYIGKFEVTSSIDKT